jgi:hypothetical protein
MRQRLAAAHKTLVGEMLPPAYHAAREILSPAAFYEEFSPLLAGLKPKRGKKGSDEQKAGALASVLTSGFRAIPLPVLGFLHRA